MQNPLVSLIIPCYNAQRFLSKSLGSVSSQTYQNWECFAVNDGSTDNTETMIKDWSEIDPRFKLISQKNAGPSGARNIGMKAATGDCIFFMDADDMLDTECLENLVGLYNSSLDIVIGKSAKVFGQTNSIHKLVNHVDNGGKVLSNSNLIKLALEELLLPVVWNKLYNRNFVISHHLSFKEGVHHEDELWTFETMYLAKNVVFNSKVTYYYNVDNPASITNNYSLVYLLSLLGIIEDIYNKYYLLEEDEEIKRFLGSYVLHLQIDATSAFYRYAKKNPVPFKDEGIFHIQNHLKKYKIENYADIYDNRKFQLFVKYAAKNPETAFKLTRNLNKRNILKFFENIYLKATH